METPDLRAYLRRIGFEGEARPDLDTLRAIQRLHSRSIPFENLNPWLGIPVLLDATSLQRKLVHGERGGYCFEHNLLLAEVLGAIGFQVTPLAARVMWGVAPDAVRPRTHMLLKIDLDEAWLADGGFGGMTLTGPLRLHAEGPQTTPHERFRVLREGDVFTMQAEVADEWRTTYRFDLQPQHRVDYELTSWYLSHHPESRFVQHLVAARTRPDGRDALLDNELTRHHLGGPSEKQVIESAAELRRVLEQVFGLRLPEVAQLQARLEQVVRPKTA
jgi:N-hydroxyarylamine O-acetyltransferase